MVGRSIQYIFNVHGSAQRQGQMSFHADPITDNNDILRGLPGLRERPWTVHRLGLGPAPKRVIIMLCERRGAAITGRLPQPRHVPGVGPQKTTFMRGPEALLVDDYAA